MSMRLNVRTAAGCGLAAMMTLFCGVIGGAAPPAGAEFAPSGHVPAPMGPQLGQSCNDPLKLAFDPSAGAMVCTRYGEWVQSANPTAVRSLGTPCPPSESNGQLLAKTPDDHLISCPVGVWTLFKP
jgi:hypothetical protein